MTAWSHSEAPMQVAAAGRKMERSPFIPWVRATWIGWLLGIPIIVLLALAGEAVGIGGAQSLVGAGMGTGVGWMQARALRGVLLESRSWILSCAIGLAAPFLAVDVSNAAGWSLPYSLFACVALGGFFAGVWQSILLRRLGRSGWWVAASGLGWALAAGVAAVADAMQRSQSIRGPIGALAYLGVVAAGGLVLGLVTGVCLTWMLRGEPAR
jgi:hypothetical protein